SSLSITTAGTEDELEEIGVTVGMGGSGRKDAEAAYISIVFNNFDRSYEQLERGLHETKGR
ncbi:MAG: hypothetical protein LH679_21745, partial [Cyanobacteria bacterium CAN_BIN43]|nr:hypothetical protein [Cyanobacteria bacterium CAN_BIN43]